MKKAKGKIKELKLNEIKPYWRNPRENKKTVELVKQSIKDYGYNQLIAVDKDNVILAGHARYKALLELGFNKIDVIIVEGLTDQQAKEYRIADNKTAEFTDWTQDLEIELNELSDLAKMQKYFEDDLGKKLERSIGEGISDVTQEDIDKGEGYNREHFRKIAKEQQKRENMICPNCGHEFEVGY